MLELILNNKLKIRKDNIEVQYNMSPSEDSFTSSVLGLLKYLPTKLFWDILSNAIIEANPNFEDAEIEAMDFWPKWDIKTKVENSLIDNDKFVEPEVIIETNKFNLIIEAKLKNNEQEKQQWINEIEAYKLEYENKAPNNLLYFLAIDGSNIYKKEFKEFNAPESTINIVILRTTWTAILKATINQIHNIQKEHLFILNDIIRCFEFQGYRHVHYFSDDENNKFEKYEIDLNTKNIWKKLN